MITGAQHQITQTVTAWPGVTATPHRFGGVEYQLDTREIGHIHGDVMLDIPFPTRLRNELVEAGLVEPHHLLHDSGWISFYIRESDDVARAIDLLQRSFDIARQQRARRKHPEAAQDGS